MPQLPSPALVAWLLPGCALLAALLTAAALGYARRAELLDAPGARRSHAQPTPRGGGAGPVAAWLLALGVLALLGWAVPHLPALMAGTALVALVGAMDDHRSLPAWPRLAVHALAALLLVGSVLGVPADAAGWLRAAAMLLALVAAVNVWNFMDGIDGIAGMQTLFVALLLAAACAWAGQWALALAAAALGAAVSGFLPFNAPRARIFLGDVGSGALGFAVGGLLLLAWRQAPVHWAALLLLPSVFVLDASLTLGSRMLAGRRWYTAHREHLYQWLVRRKLSHARVVALYLLWNVLIVTPLAIAVLWHRIDPLAALLGLYSGGALAWLVARRRLLARARRYGSPA